MGQVGLRKRFSVVKIRNGMEAVYMENETSLT